MSPRPSSQAPPDGPPRARRRRRRLAGLVGLLAVGAAAAGVFMAATASSVPPVPPVLATSTQFDVTGFIQKATLDNPASADSGGTLQVNGKTIVIPKNTIVIFPASAQSWQEVFTKAPAPYTGSQSGLAIEDTPTPSTTYEVSITGNRVLDNPGVNGCPLGGNPCDRYIAGMVHISQQDLNGTSGYINFIDYTNGELEVGGTPGVQGTGTRVKINDPAIDNAGNGRFGRAWSPDVRFTVDQDNPTIGAETGYPMCIPRTDPAVADDPLCPEANRPRVNVAGADQSGVAAQPNALVPNEAYRIFRMDRPTNVDANPAACLTPGACRDPRKQAPFEVGDYVTYAGNVMTDGSGKLVAAHTITASLGIYTQPGVDPAYTNIEVGIIGTGGLTVFGAGEAAIRTRFEGFTTDETRQIHLYGVDINPKNGSTSDRDWGTIMPDPGPDANGAVRGRWRFRPPCTGAVATQKVCTPPPGGNFIPPTREVRAVIEGLQQFTPGTQDPNPKSQVPGTPGAATVANGIYWGQYHAPIGEYIFPENVPGSAVPEDNFNTIPFLAAGGYSSNGGFQAGVLDPWPSNVLPPPVVCATATMQGDPYSVANGGSVQLQGTLAAGTSTPITIRWTAGTAVGGTDLNAALTNANTLTPTFSAAGLPAGVYNVRLSVTNLCGTVTKDATITVQAAPPPAINPIQNQTVTAGNPVSIVATSTSLPAPTWTWTQQAADPIQVPGPLAGAPVGTTATSTLSLPALAAGTYHFNVTATNINGTSSVTTVTVTATAAVPTDITLATEYRTSKQRLVVTATTTNPLVLTGMTLLPYLTETGTTFDPAQLGANGLTVSLTAPGTWTITAVGAPRPACNMGGAYVTPCAQKPLTVKEFVGANVVGTSVPTAIQKIRQ